MSLNFRSTARHAALAVALMGLACVDSIAPGATERTGQGDVVLVDYSGSVAVRDASIDLNDTHLALVIVADVGLTIRSDTLFRNPMTGALTNEFTFPVKADSLQVEHERRAPPARRSAHDVECVSG